MNLVLRCLRLLGACWLLALGLLGATPALAQDYTQGVDVSGTTATIWFKSNVSTTWVDVHYTVNNGAQQNIRMTAANGRYEQKLTVASGNVIGYWFTYNNGTPAYDTPKFSYTVNGNTQASGPICFYADINYAGDSFCASADSSWIGTAWNDRVSSVKVQAGYQVTLYNDVNYGGSSLVLTADEPNLVNRAFNDLTSSYKVGQASGNWNGRTTFNIVNQTGGRWADEQVYWAIIGKDWSTGKFVRVDAAGNFIPMSTSDNGALTKNGVAYTNYFHKLSNTRSITIPALNSARVLMSVGSPMYIRVVVDGNGNIGYAGANIENPTDPNIDVYFDFGEMAIIPQGQADPGIFINTTRVDHFGFPLKLRVQGLGGYDQTVGEALAETRDSLFSQYIAAVPAEFKPLAQAPYSPYRIIAPAHGTFKPGAANANYLQPYIDAVWARYRNEDLVFTLQNLGTFRGRISGDRWTFTGGSPAGTFYINGKPDTASVLLGAGLLADGSGNPTNVGTQLQIQAQICAALNRHVLETPANWYVQSAHYPSGTLGNWYAKFWHDHSINKKAYGFAYDDVGDFSPSLHTQAPTTVTYTIGW